MEHLKWTEYIAFASRPAIDICSIFVDFSFFSGERGTEFVTMTLSKHDFSIRSIAGPLNNPWVANANIRLAPRLLNSSPALQRVPAVSIMSSTITQSHPSTSPTKSICPITPACTRCLTIIARLDSTPSSFNLSRKDFARKTPPASGETTTQFCKPMFWKYGSATNAPFRLSQGVRGPKKPWICPQCKSTAMTRSTPMDSNKRAISAASTPRKWEFQNLRL